MGPRISGHAPLALAVALCSGAACGGRNGNDRDAASADAASGDAPSSDRALYQPNALYDDVQQVDVMLHDAARNRDLNVRIRVSPSAPQPIPVVVISHGGSENNNGHTALAGWGEGLAAAGYATFNIAHAVDDPTSHCGPLGIPTGECDEMSDFGEDTGTTLGSNWYNRPLDISFLIDSIPGLAARRGVEVDMARVGMVGHSRGGWTTQVIAGARIDFSPSVTGVTLADERVRCFVVNSPSVPGRGGLTRASFDTIRGPLSYQTGRGDNSDGQTAEERAGVFDFTAGPDTYLTFLDADGATHEFFSLQEGLDDPMEQWLLAGGLATLDAYARDDAEALAWLSSGDLEAVSGGVATITRR